MLLELDPLPLYSEDEAIALFDKNAINRATLNLKLNFSRFVNRFETENVSVTEFGENLDMRQRLLRIREILNQYNNEDINSKQLSTGVQPAQGN